MSFEAWAEDKQRSAEVQYVCMFIVNVQLSFDETYADVTPVRSDANMTSAFVYVAIRYCPCVGWLYSVYSSLANHLLIWLCLTGLFMQPPSGRRRMRICFADVFFCFLFFSVRQKYETTILRNGWTDFHETFTKRYRGKCSLKRRAAAWRKSCHRLANGECWWFA